MSRFLFIMIVSGITAYASSLVLPWWIIGGIGFFAGFGFSDKSMNAFLAPALGIGFAWLIPALFIDMGNQQILSTRIAELLQLPFLGGLYLLTFLIPFIVSGIFGMAGFWCWRLYDKK